jgi:hypothetical protein
LGRERKDFLLRWRLIQRQKQPAAVAAVNLCSRDDDGRRPSPAPGGLASTKFFPNKKFPVWRLTNGEQKQNSQLLLN